MKHQENDFKFNTIERIGFYSKIIKDLNIKYWVNLAYQYQKNYPISVHKSNEGGYQSESYLNKLPPFLPLVRLLQTTIDRVNPNHHNVINSLWLNISPPLSYNAIHSHTINGEEAFSGVIYLQTPPKSGDINFYYSTNINKFISYNPSPQEILLFPNNLLHSVDPNFSQKDRISIAFNFN